MTKEEFAKEFETNFFGEGKALIYAECVPGGNICIGGDVLAMLTAICRIIKRIEARTHENRSEILDALEAIMLDLDEQEEHLA